MTGTHGAAAIGLAVATLVCACGEQNGAGGASAAEELRANGKGSSSTSASGSSTGSSSSSQCANPGGVNGVLAAIAIAAANEMHRWLPGRDFQWNDASGQLELSSWAYPRCPNRSCPNTQALLDLQKPEAAGSVTFDGRIRLDVGALRSQLKANWDAQIACNLAGNCPVQYHDLVLHHTEGGPCGTRYFYDAFEQGTTTPLDAAAAALFANQLIFLGQPNNPLLAFAVQDDRASVDPTAGLNEGSITTSGSCSALCVKYSATDVQGACCACNGVTGRYAVSTFSTRIYLCR